MPCVQTQIYLFLCSKFLRSFLLVCVLIVSLPMNVCSSQLGVCVIHWLATQLVFLRCEFCFLLVLQATPRSHYGFVRFNFPPLFLSCSFAYFRDQYFLQRILFCLRTQLRQLLTSVNYLPRTQAAWEERNVSLLPCSLGSTKRMVGVFWRVVLFLENTSTSYTCSCIHAGILQGLFCDVLPYIRNNRKWCLPSLCLFLLTCLNTTASYIAQPVLPRS